MPTCFCVSFGCAKKNPQGCEVDTRTFKYHLREDRLIKVREAQAESDRVVEAQRVTIGEYIGSFALADKVSPPPGTRLWSKRTPEHSEIDDIAQHISVIDLDETQIPDANHPPNHRSRPASPAISPKPSRRRKVEMLLTQLAEIEHDVDSLSERAKIGLESLKHISGIISASFPLKDLYLDCKSLSTDLNNINGKAHSVIEFKSRIEIRLEPIRESLKKAKLDWSARWSSTPVQDVFNQGVEHKTGQYIAS